MQLFELGRYRFHIYRVLVVQAIGKNAVLRVVFFGHLVKPALRFIDNRLRFIDFRTLCGEKCSLDQRLGNQFAFPALNFLLFLFCLFVFRYFNNLFGFSCRLVSVLHKYEDIVSHRLLPIGKENLINIVLVY